MIADDLAAFVKNADYKELSEQAIEQLKIRLLDAIGVIEGSPVQAMQIMITWILNESFLAQGETCHPSDDLIILKGTMG